MERGSTTLFDELERCILSGNGLEDAGIHCISMARLDDRGDISTYVVPGTSGDPDTMFQAASISKAITALGVAKLADQGVIDLDGKVTDYLPSDVLHDLGLTDPCVEDVTVEALLSHRSGLSQSGVPGYATGEIPTYEEIFKGRPPAVNPRIQFESFPFSRLSYSGGGYLLLQIVLEHLMKRSFAQIMEETVLKPLGMSRSTFEDLSAEEKNYARAWETAYQPVAHTEYHRFPERAAAGLWSTPTDLLRVIAAIQDSLHSEGGFISKTVAQRLLTKVTPNNDVLSIAMGWAANDTFFCHRGENRPGYHAFVIGTHSGAVNESTDLSARSVKKGGFAIMIDSVAGLPILRKVVAAFFFLNEWPLVDSLPSAFGGMINLVPFAAAESVEREDESWKGWIGEWEGGWTIGTDEEDVPTLAFQDGRFCVKLRRGALPVLKQRGRKEETFVTERYDIALRFGWDGDVGSETLTMISGDGGKVEILRKLPK